MNTAELDNGVADARVAVAENPYWYHTMEVAPGVETPGVFDLRPTVERLPWPDVRGRRCLDIGTWDGFFAFELERRGAAEVVATDIADHDHWDWPAHVRARGVEYMHAVSGPEKSLGFGIAKTLLGSSARLQQVNVYDLSPDAVGEFDVVVCGSLLLHLRDPLRALAAIQSVCRGQFLVTNQIDLRRSISQRTQPLLRLDGLSDLCQWWLPNVAGNRQLVRAGGFELERESRVYAVPFGTGHVPLPTGPRAQLTRLSRRLLLAGANGVAHHALLARPPA